MLFYFYGMSATKFHSFEGFTSLYIVLKMPLARNTWVDNTATKRIVPNNGIYRGLDTDIHHCTLPSTCSTKVKAAVKELIWIIQARKGVEQHQCLRSYQSMSRNLCCSDLNWISRSLQKSSCIVSVEGFAVSGLIRYLNFLQPTDNSQPTWVVGQLSQSALGEAQQPHHQVWRCTQLQGGPPITRQRNVYSINWVSNVRSQLLRLLSSYAYFDQIKILLWWSSTYCITITLL